MNSRRNSGKIARRWPLWLLTFSAFGVICATRLYAGLGYVIFDPSNFIKNVQQVIALVQQVALASEQIRQQEQMLAHLPTSVADAVALAGRSLQGQLSTTVDSDEGSIDSRYPVSFPEPELAWLDIMRPTWMQQERSQLLQERDLARQVQDQMVATSDHLRTIVEASNGAGANHWELPGQVAAAQAHVELLAICSVEIDKLLALRTARARRNSETRARTQSEAAYQEARRNFLMGDSRSATQRAANQSSFLFGHN